VCEKKLRAEVLPTGRRPSYVVLATQCRSVQRAEPERRNFGQRFAFGQTPSHFVFDICGLTPTTPTRQVSSARRGGYSVATDGERRKKEKKKRKEKKRSSKVFLERIFRAEVCLRADAQLHRAGYPMSIRSTSRTQKEEISGRGLPAGGRPVIFSRCCCCSHSCVFFSGSSSGQTSSGQTW